MRYYGRRRHPWVSLFAALIVFVLFAAVIRVLLYLSPFIALSLIAYAAIEARLKRRTRRLEWEQHSIPLGPPRLRR